VPRPFLRILAADGERMKPVGGSMVGVSPLSFFYAFLMLFIIQPMKHATFVVGFMSEQVEEETKGKTS